MEVSYCGFHTHNIDKDIIYRPNGLSDYLFLLILSPMIFRYQDGSSEEVRPGACILFTPKTYQNYQAEKVFFNSFVEFSSSVSLEKEFHLPYNRIFYPSNHELINHLLQEITQEYFSKSPFSKEMQQLYLKQLLISLVREQSNPVENDYFRPDLYYEFMSVRLTMLSHCNEQWTIAKLCNLLSLGKSQLYKLYKEFFHSTPLEELIQARLQNALFLMTNESMTIKQAAFSAGFQNINHFNRIFKKKFNCSPTEFRKKYEL